jgi:membrane protein DedA with SNARE-associated domain
MEAWLEESIRLLSETPFLQGSLAAVSTFILEDPTLLMCALLVADHQMLYMTALIGLSLGIGLGDWGLYAIGRVVGPKTVTWGWVSQRRLDKAGGWFERNLVVALFVSRFIPGLRLPTNIAAGIAQASPVRYLPVALAASLIWVFLALTAISSLGEMVLPILGELKWPAVIILTLWVIWMQRRTIRKLEEEDEFTPGNLESPVASSYYEFWHPVIFYVPVAFYYGWLALRYRGLMLPTAVNPSIYSGGMIRESKCDILDMLPEQIQQWVSPHTRYDVPHENLSGNQLLQNAQDILANENIKLPIVAKPDEGQRGVGVRPIYTDEELQTYLEEYPKGSRICLQELCPYTEEVGLLYYRMPSEEKGQITSVTAKDFASVMGDGKQTLRELIESDPRAKMMADTFLARHQDVLDTILEKGQRFQLVFAGNHKQGCIFRDGSHLLNDTIAEKIDLIAKQIPDFYFGRFDIRYKDLESFQQGESFKIIEINGAGAEATHIWDPEGTLLGAYGTLFEQFRVLFEIGSQNRKAGHRPLGAISFLNDVLQYHRVARRYPAAK